MVKASSPTTISVQTPVNSPNRAAARDNSARLPAPETARRAITNCPPSMPTNVKVCV